MKVKVTFGGWYDRVELDGEQLRPERSLALVNHSPTGFSWGYGGSGPAQLALAILLAAGADNNTAVREHQRFKWEHVATWPAGQSGEFEVDVAGWLEARHAEWGEQARRTAS